MAGMRISWSRDDYAEVGRVVNEIVDGIIAGEISTNLSPTELQEASQDAGRLYHAALTPATKCPWAQVQFPKGFDSLVEQVNEQLSIRTPGITCKNATRPHLPYLSHSQYQLDRITAMSDEYARGELERDDALAALHDENIRLSPGQLQIYFRESLRRDPEIGSSLDERKEILARRMNEVKQELQIDLTDLDCLKGILFEDFVGTVLVHLYSGDAVESQKRLPVTYMGLDGRRHSRVFLDFLLADVEAIETKYMNNFDNIIDSALAQRAALEERNVTRHLTNPGELTPIPPVTVVYRRPTPDMSLAMKYNISLDQEADAMQLDQLDGFICDLIQYLPVNELIQREDSPDIAQIFMRSLTLVDILVEEGDILRIKSCAKSFEQIFKNGQQIPEKLEVLCEIFESGDSVAFSDLTGWFGVRSPNTAPNDRDHEDRMRIIRRSVLNLRDRDLRTLYNLAFKDQRTDLSEEMISSLETLDKSAFDALVRTLIEEKQDRLMQRREDSKARRKAQDPLRKYFQLCDRYHRRAIELRVERMERLRITTAERIPQYKEMVADHQRRLQANAEWLPYLPDPNMKGRLTTEIVKILRKVPDSQDAVADASAHFADAFCDRSVFVADLLRDFQDMQHEVFDHGQGREVLVEAAEYSRETVEKHMHAVRALLQCHSDYCAMMREKYPFLELVASLSERIAERGVSSLNSRERKHVVAFADMFSCFAERASLEVILRYSEMFELAAEFAPLFAGNKLHHFHYVNQQVYAPNLEKFPPHRRSLSAYLPPEAVLVQLYFDQGTLRGLRYGARLEGVTLAALPDLEHDAQVKGLVKDIFNEDVASQAFHTLVPLSRDAVKLVNPTDHTALARECYFLDRLLESSEVPSEIAQNLEQRGVYLHGMACSVHAWYFRGILDETGVRPFESSKPLTQTEYNDFVSEKSTQLYEFLHTNGHLLSHATSDLYLRKAFLSRIVEDYSPDRALEFLRANRIPFRELNLFQADEAIPLVLDASANIEHEFREIMAAGLCMN